MLENYLNRLSIFGRPLLTALKTEALLSETIGAGYLDRHWPLAFRETGAWPLTSLRQSFLNGSLTRLIDPDAVLRRKIVEFVENGAFGLASRPLPDGGYERLWHAEPVGTEEVAFDQNVFLLTKARSEALWTSATLELKPHSDTDTNTPPPTSIDPDAGRKPKSESRPHSSPIRLQVSGTVPPELWNRLGTKLIPKLRSADALTAQVEFSAEVASHMAESLGADIEKLLTELDLDRQVRIERLPRK